MSKPRIPIEQRFWSKVKKPLDVESTNGCWLWTGARGSHKGKLGQGQILKGGRGSGLVVAHRLSWELHTGTVLPAEIKVLHKCDSPDCVRFDHLFIGTSRDSAQDRVQKGKARGARGEAHFKCKLNKEAVLYIRSLPSLVGLRKALSDKYAVSKSTISQIHSRQTWKWLEQGTGKIEQEMTNE